ncbi:MAG: nucleotidyltransferase [Candidatus Magasanikbacteria bacterium CG10_big_fil_rev_8_21_14_0_10_40_10]|uniref:Nucleotidyltransferase n=1 Tax=Candidatus Magasanikbacteria bacterium CG10_big_fil_rev_8_21_14_0_10_40_10 TaxID=1974648 RepID=A0A2M6W2R4_9BACT|nr:MAG: nucleotidyltransferase [Candidatus Magasanikbacteria bacterium CG10_big_fil_rev_8_21_14_0_10_40_10]
MDKKIYNSKQVKRYASDFVAYLKKQHGLEIDNAYIFGSYAKKNPRQWSDIDVCVISSKFIKTDPLVYLWGKRRDIDIERGIEPYGLSPAGFVNDNPVAYEVKKYGVRL